MRNGSVLVTGKTRRDAILHAEKIRGLVKLENCTTLSELK